MPIRRLLLLVGLCVLFAGCSTGRSGFNELYSDESSADLGTRYLLGRGVPQNNAKAFSYFSKAANEDDPFAQNELAFMYAAGKGTPRDYSKALLYYSKAAEHGLASAQYNLGLMYLHGLGTPPNQTIAMKWFKQSAAHGFEPARKEVARYQA